MRQSIFTCSMLRRFGCRAFRIFVSASRILATVGQTKHTHGSRSRNINSIEGVASSNSRTLVKKPIMQGIILIGLAIFVIGLSSSRGVSYFKQRETTLTNLSQAWSLSRKDVLGFPADCSGAAKMSGLLSLPTLKFLPNFKNPCWYEPLEDSNTYKTNQYADGSALNMFKEMTDEWTKMLKNNIRHRRLRCLPYFFLAGMPKCGSTDLYEKMTSHPDIVVAPMKEPHWWARGRFGIGAYDDGDTVPIKDYIDLYDKASLFIEHIQDPNVLDGEGYHQLITGDASVSTFWLNDYWWHLKENCGDSEPKFTNAHYIKHLLPTSKIIVTFRNPTDRLYSDYLYFEKKNKSAGNFHKETKKAIDAFELCLKDQSLRSCTFNQTIAGASRVSMRIGLFHVFLQEWLKVFPMRQIHVVRLEDYSKHPLQTLREVYTFLGLRQLTPKEEEQINEISGRANARRKKDKNIGVMRNDTRMLIDRFYLPYNQELSILLHDSKYLWNAKK